MKLGFELFDKEEIGSIELGNKVRISDPCYDVNTWCAGTLESVLPGEYQCFMQRTDMKDWGVRIANIEVRHKDYLDVEPIELQDIDVGVDSGQAGIYDLDYFIEARKDKNGKDEWYDRVCDTTYVTKDNPEYVPFKQSSYWKEDFKELNGNVALMLECIKAESDYRFSKEGVLFVSELTAGILDNKCFVSSSGDGDGSYVCFVGRNDEGKIVSIKMDYYYGYEEDEEYDEEYE